MITEEILHIAMEQSAEDINCKTEDFLKNQNVIVPFRLGKKARKYRVVTGKEKKANGHAAAQFYVCSGV